MNENARKFFRCCQECGEEFSSDKQWAAFCSTPCRKEFNNRRAIRGAEIYDLFMMMRYERGIAKVRGVWALMCRIGQGWREEDEAKRAGRHSWNSYEKLAADGRFCRYSYLTKTNIRAGR